MLFAISSEMWTPRFSFTRSSSDSSLRCILPHPSLKYRVVTCGPLSNPAGGHRRRVTHVPSANSRLRRLRNRIHLTIDDLDAAIAAKLEAAGVISATIGPRGGRQAEFYLKTHLEIIGSSSACR